MSSLLDQIFDEYKTLSVIDKELAPTKKRDASDHYLGTLSLILQKVWVVKEKNRLLTEELVSKTVDLIQCFYVDMKKYDNIPDWIMTDYGSSFTDLLDQLKPAVKKFKFADNVFRSLVCLEFDLEQNMPVIAIRSGYKVHCRKDNSRGDVCEPLKPLLEYFNLNDSLPQIQASAMIVKVPEGVDPSKLSQKELLKIILDSME